MDPAVLLTFLLCRLCPRRALDVDWRRRPWPWLQLWGHVCALPLSHQHRGAAWCLVSAKGVCPCLLGCPQALCPTSGSLVPCQLLAASSACCAQATLRPACVCLGWGGVVVSVRVCLGFGGVCFSCIYGLVLQPFYFGFVFSVVVEWSSPRCSRCQRLRGWRLVPICRGWGVPTAGVQRLVVAFTVRARTRSGCGRGSPECAKVEDESSVPAVVGGPLAPLSWAFFPSFQVCSQCCSPICLPPVSLPSYFPPLYFGFCTPPSLLPPAFPSAP